MSEASVRRARVVVVGAGLMGRWHAHAAERLGADVVGVVDISRAAAEQLAAAHRGAAVFEDLPAALSRGDVDVVHVCTPAGAHAALVETALEGGCHALVEKPLAASLSETEELIALAHARGLALNPVHQLPFQPGFLSLVARRAELGELVRISHRTCSAGGEGRSAEDRRAILLEILPHPVSLFARVLEDFDPVVLEISRFTEDDLDLVGHVSGVRLDVAVSLRGRPTSNELHIVGTRASAIADLFHGFAVVEDGRVSRPAKVLRPFRLGGGMLAHAGGNLALRAVRREPAYPGLRELVRRFHAAALRGGEPPVPDAETIAAARLVERVRAGG